jgi:hypothetical protein
MAQSAVTVTPDGPTPPTNFTGQIGMRPPTTAGLNPIDDGNAAAWPSSPNAGGSLILFATPSVAGGSAYEGAGTEASYTATSANPSPAGQTVMVSDLGNYTTSPNGDHASSLSPTTNPTLTSISPNSSASGAGNVTLTCTGTNFTPQSVIYVNGVAQVTTFVSKTSLTASVAKKATAGTWPVTVVTGGVVTTAAQTWTFT